MWGPSQKRYWKRLLNASSEPNLPEPSLPESGLAELAAPEFIDWVRGTWGIEISGPRPEFEIQGSPERSLSRGVVEDRDGRLFLVEKFSRERHRLRNRVARTLMALNRQGLDQALAPERATDGDPLLFFKGGCFQFTRFLTSTPLERPQWLEFGELGRHMAEFLIQMDRTAATLPGLNSGPAFSIKNYTYRLFRDMAAHNPGAYERYKPVLAFLEKGFMPAHDQLNSRFCHGDFHPLNIIWRETRVRAVIDWEFTGVKPDCYDAANLLGCAGIEHPEGLAGPMAIAFLDELRSTDVISPSGWQWLPEYVLALRFAWLSEWLRKADEEMLDLECRFMGILMDHMADLREIWQCCR